MIKVRLPAWAKTKVLTMSIASSRKRSRASDYSVNPEKDKYLLCMGKDQFEPMSVAEHLPWRNFAPCNVLMRHLFSQTRGEIDHRFFTPDQDEPQSPRVVRDIFGRNVMRET
jgi:hypothetical protein